MCLHGDLKAINRYLESTEYSRICPLYHHTGRCHRNHCIQPMSWYLSRKLVCHVTLLANDKSDKRSTEATWLKMRANIDVIQLKYFWPTEYLFLRVWVCISQSFDHKFNILKSNYIRNLTYFVRNIFDHFMNIHFSYLYYIECSFSCSRFIPSPNICHSDLKNSYHITYQWIT